VVIRAKIDELEKAKEMRVIISDYIKNLHGMIGIQRELLKVHEEARERPIKLIDEYLTKVKEKPPAD
jgi:hypothetical protein